MPIYVGDYLPVLGCELDDTRSSFNAESKDALLDSWYAFKAEASVTMGKDKFLQS